SPSAAPAQATAPRPLRRRLARPSNPQVRFPHFGIIQKIGGGAAEAHLAGFEHVTPRGERERGLDVLLDDEERPAAGRDLRQDAGKILDDDRGEAERELVDQEQARAGHQAAGDRYHLLLTAAQVDRELALALAQAREEPENFGVGPPHGGRVAAGVGAEE